MKQFHFTADVHLLAENIDDAMGKMAQYIVEYGSDHLPTFLGHVKCEPVLEEQTHE